MNELTKLSDDFLTFSGMLTGYRLTQVMLTIAESGVIPFVDEDGTSCDVLCQKAGWSLVTGKRFINCLCDLGFLNRNDDLLFLTPFSARFLHPDSDDFQGNSLLFEKKLIANWQTLTKTLDDGSCPVPKIKSTSEYESALKLFLGAMDEAAGIRAKELWTQIQLPEQGTILDVGAGSGAYLVEFLKKYRLWEAVFCDLSDVVNMVRQKSELAQFGDRVRYVGCNFLDNNEKKICGLDVDVILLSNIVHCQSKHETEILFTNTSKALKPGGRIIVHDFFRKANNFGSLYDLHMMVNTYNGRTYSQGEVEYFLEMVKMKMIDFILLPSGSAVLIGE